MAFGCPRECESFAPVTGACVCPEGCSGDDDWEQWTNTCHVNLAVRDAMHVAATLLGVLLFMECMAAGWLVSSDEHSLWSRFKRLVARVSKGGCSSGPGKIDDSFADSEEEDNAGPDESDSGGPAALAAASGAGVAPVRGRAARVQIQHQSKLSSYLILWITVFAMGLVASQTLMLAGVYRWQADPAASAASDLAIAVAVAGMLLGLWTAAIKWYAGLPNLQRFGRLFGFSTLLIRNPRAFTRWCKLWSVLSVVAAFSVMLVLPQARPENRRLYDRLSLGLIGALLSLWFVSMGFLSWLLLRLVHMVRVAIERDLQRPVRRPTGSGSGAGSSRRGSHGAGNPPGSPGPLSASPAGSASAASIALAARARELSDMEEADTAGLDIEPGPGESALQQELRRLRTTVLLLVAFAVLGVGLGDALLFGGAFVDELRENMYVTFQVVAITAAVGAAVLLYLIIFRSMLPRAC